MPTSQNGYSANDRSVIRSATIAGTDVKVSLRTGPAGDLLLYAAARWHREVEPLRAPDGVLDCWGYAERTIRGDATTLSNHASGTAIDLRARAHPLGTDPAHTLTPAQIVAIRRIVDDCAGALRWGGDYGNPARGGVAGSRWDVMHLEVNATAQRCAQVLLLLTATGGAPASGHPTIRRGDTGPAVELIQRFLGVARVGDAGYGTFGPATEAAVRRYQLMRGLEVDGICGPATWKATGL